MPAIGQPPMTYVHTSAVNAGQTELYTFHNKTNKIYIRSAQTFKYAYRGVTPPAALGAAGDNAGINVTAAVWKELTVSVGTDRINTLQVILENSVNNQVYEIEAEE